MDNNNIPEILYYYCNMNEFIDIITNKRFMLKDLQKCDKFINLDKVIDILNERILNKEKTLIKENEDVFFTIPIWTLKDQIKEYNYRILPFFYALVLTSNCNKWYMYQKNSADLCVGIKTNPFKRLKKDDVINLKRVSYNIKELESIVDVAIDNYFQECKQNIDNTYNIGDEFKKIWTYINDDLIIESIAYKNSFFSDENEYRLIFNSKIRKIFLEQDNRIEKLQEAINLSFESFSISLSKTSFITVNNQLLSYRYFGYNDISNLIDSVYINPTSQITESDIKLLLSANSINFDKITKTTLK